MHERTNAAHKSSIIVDHPTIHPPPSGDLICSKKKKAVQDGVMKSVWLGVIDIKRTSDKLT